MPFVKLCTFRFHVVAGRVSQKNSSMELTRYSLGSTAPDKSNFGTLPTHKEAILINFIPDALSLIKNKFTDQI